jgi:hypothetical protein
LDDLLGLPTKAVRRDCGDSTGAAQAENKPSTRE